MMLPRGACPTLAGQRASVKSVSLATARVAIRGSAVAAKVADSVRLSSPSGTTKAGTSEVHARRTQRALLVIASAVRKLGLWREPVCVARSWKPTVQG